MEDTSKDSSTNPQTEAVKNALPKDLVANGNKRGQRRRSIKDEEKAKEGKAKEVTQNIFWLSLGLVILFIIISLGYLCYLGMGGKTPNIQGALNVLLILSVSISTLCTVLLIGHIAGINTINSWFARGIWAAAFVSTLTFNVKAVNSLFMTNQNPMKVEVTLIDETNVKLTKVDNEVRPYLERIVDKPSNYYTVKDNKLILAVIIQVSNYDESDLTEGNIQGEIALLNQHEPPVADLGQLPLAKSKLDWQQRFIAQHLPKEEFNRVANLTKEKLAFIQILDDFHPEALRAGPATFRVTIYDRKNQTYALAELNIVLHTVTETSLLKTPGQ